MNRFAELLDRLAYEPGRNNKLRLMTDYFRGTPDPERGFALAALTGALSFQHAKPSVIRALIAERVDPVLFEMSYDYIGDLSETVALMWVPRTGATGPPQPCNVTPSGAQETAAGRDTPKHGELLLSSVITALSSLGKTQLPGQLARWLDQLDETGRWALLKLVTGGLRIGVSARLAKTAVAALGDKEPHEIELIWPEMRPPYVELFAWLEGHSEKPASHDSAPFRPAMLAHALEDGDLIGLDPKDFMAEWKWDGIRVQAVAGRSEDGRLTARLYSPLRLGTISSSPAKILPRRARTPMPMQSRASCLSGATRLMCRAAPRARGGSGSAIRSSSMQFCCTRSAVTASAHHIIRITHLESGPRARKATC